MKREGYWFKSSKFQIEPGEDDEINPQIYGRQLARWLKQRLHERGYTVEEIINEDWGRCLMCGREPVMLWVGCASVTDDEAAGPGSVPAADEVTWHCFAVAEAPLLKKLLGKVDVEPALTRLHEDLGAILRAEATITLVDE